MVVVLSLLDFFIVMWICGMDMVCGYGKVWIWEGVDMLGRRNVVINSLWSICIL
jgi:hypothetical protein